MATLTNTSDVAPSGFYDYVFKDLADPRIYDWPLMADPSTITYICLIYLYVIYYWLPNYMSKKEPFDLKRIIQLYNIFQIVYCSILVYGFATSGWTTHYKWGCQEIDYSNNPQAYRMASVFWYTHILKIVDLVEAIFFILRKKFNQVSALHVYHHVSMVYTSWIATKYCAGGMVSFYPMLNNVVHVVMYTYYLLATLGPDMQKKLAKFKPKITMMQMISFTVMLLHLAMALRDKNCYVPNCVLFVFTPNLIVIFYMFYKFYSKNYSAGKAKKVK